MSFHLDDTIAALSSASGPGGLNIIRVSGPQTRAILEQRFHPRESERWKSAHRSQRHSGEFQLSEISTPIPLDVYLWPTTRSYTGQPLAELHLPGSPPLIDAMLTELFRLGARPANRGEFTLRAFLSGKIDLVQAEGVLGVIDSVSTNEFRTALEQLAGGISGRFTAIRRTLLELLADIEAGLDFVDEDIEFITLDELQSRLTNARDELLAIQQQARQRMQSATAPRVVLAGLPNAGKSTLFNAIISDQAAMVSDVAGTTRDYLSRVVTWNNSAWELIDTAGWEESNAGIEGAAQSLRADQWKRADLIVVCHPATDSVFAQRTESDRLEQQLQESGKPLIRVRTKCDLGIVPHQADIASSPMLSISAVTGAGVSDLCDSIASQIAGDRSGEASWLSSTSARCAESLTHAIGSLDRSLTAVDDNLGDELVSSELRHGLNHIGRIIGEVYTDDVLDSIFSRFCIGK